MIASSWLLAGLVCLQVGPAEIPVTAPVVPAPGISGRAEGVPTPPVPRPTASRVVAVTVYRGRALVTREVDITGGQGGGTVELAIGALPPRTIDGSLHAEGTDGLRVLSTRLRSRVVKEESSVEVRAIEGEIKKLQAEAQKLEQEIAVLREDLQYLHKLEGFTGSSLASLTEKGRLDSEAILGLSKYIMESRGTKAKSETDLRQRLEANKAAAEFARRRLSGISAGSSRTERDAVILVRQVRGGPGTVRLGYLVEGANWTPQYRIRAATGDGPVRLEYLAAVAQQTGEAWSNVRVTLSTSSPALESAPPELLPLNMAVAGTATAGPVDADDDRSRKINTELARPVDMPFAKETPLEGVLKHVRGLTRGRDFPEGIPIYVDPVGLQEAEKTMASIVVYDVSQVPLRTSLRLVLRQLNMGYVVKDGLLTITSLESADQDEAEADGRALGGREGLAGGGMGGMGGGMGGMGLTTGLAGEAGAVLLNRAAASEQAAELRPTDRQAPGLTAAEKEAPNIAFSIADPVDLPSRDESLLLEVARVELPAEYQAKAVPVLTPRVYRLARLTNKSPLVLLPGEAMMYVGGDFVGRMNMPLVAAGEPFIAGLGIDPQLQVSRRLVRKARAVQGGNQVLTYEFRIGLRNYRATPVKVQLWDRLPKPEGDTVGVNLVKTSTELSSDPAYLRTARNDNLLRWDIEVPAGATGDSTMYLTYEFRMEYALALPAPRFLSGGLREGPIGGGAISGGMGGMR